MEDQMLHLELQAGEALRLSLLMALPTDKERKNTDE